MPSQWSADDDCALLLSLVQVMAPNGPSKHQFEAARAALDNRWTLSAISQHYNKKLRTLSPATEGAGADPATPVRSATKRKALAGKAADPTASPTPGAESGRGKKKAAAAAKVLSEEVVERDDEDDEQSPAKKTKVDVGGEASEGQE
ncbi:hypothetical protein Q7P35_008157 [Cladosporium inversicolor]